uniref:PDZ domain-containing protein n=1 Tax=Branchiostoma floridae TaxID=7739 RepID=C3ZYI6_BRAFL|eukprot:XP_002586397.1 hypothetical protein BRAFLDRAFT_252795 [Branchiostoma floridae]
MLHVETRSLGRRSLSSNVRRLHDHLNVSLDEAERQEFVQALNDYHYKRNVYDLVYNLRILLDTPEKRQLFSLLRKVIPKSDQALFDMHTSEAFLSKAPGIHRAASMPNFATDSLQDMRKIVIKKPASSKEGMGFSIRGGWEHGVGIYVSCVDPDSLSEKEGLLVGDQILRVNDLNFEKMTHEEAAKIFRVGRKFVLLVRQVGRIPKSYVASQTYTWVDPQGRSISPPPEMDLSGKNPQDSVGRRSGMNLLKDSDERKVNLVVGEGSSLGLMIRGGKEFDLGIYITGVDPYSVAEEAGLKVGDQILDVNSVNFLSISHDEAVRILKTSKHMMMTIKDVGRLPYARTTYDRTQWLMGDQLSQHQVAVFKDK